MKINRTHELYEAFADGSSFNNGHKNHSLRSGGIGVYFPNYSQSIILVKLLINLIKSMQTMWQSCWHVLLVI